MSVLDHSRSDVFGHRLPRNTNGSLRPKLPMVYEVVVHYGGAGSNWTDEGDTDQEIRNIEAYASGPSKRTPWEYNVVVDSAMETWEYAGQYRAAHNKGIAGRYGNSTALGILCLYGLENIDGAVAWRFVAGVRKALRQLIAAGWLSPNFTIRRHGDVRTGGTQCPGPIGRDPYWSAIIAPLAVSAPIPAPIPAPVVPKPIDTLRPVTVPEGEVMKAILWQPYGYANVFRITDATIRTVTPAQYSVYSTAGEVTVQEPAPHPQGLAQALRESGMDVGELVAA